MKELNEKELVIRANNKLSTIVADAAKEELYYKHLNLIKSIANKYYVRYNKKYEFQDLVAYGTNGFFHALNNFDINKDFKLSTYAYMWIEQYIQRGINKLNNDINIPYEVIKRYKEINNYKEEYKNEFGCWPTSKQIAKHFQISTKKVVETLKACKDPVSLDTVINNDDNATLSELVVDSNLTPHEYCLKKDNENFIDKQLKKILSPNEYFVIVHSLELNNNDKYKQEEMAQHLHLSVPRIKQLKISGNQKLMKNKNLFVELY